MVIRRLGNPFWVEANPVREGLKALVLAQKATFEKIMSCMDASLDEICNVMNMLYKTEAGPSLEEDEFCLLTSQKEIANRTDLLFSNAKTECNVVLNMDLLKREQNFLERFQNAVKNGATIRLIVETPREDERIAGLVEMVRPKNGSFSAKTMVTKMLLPFMLIDGRTIWIATSKMLIVSGRALPCVLWSNGKNLVSTYQDRFERLWKSMKAAPLARFPIAEAK